MSSILWASWLDWHSDSQYARYRIISAHTSFLADNTSFAGLNLYLNNDKIYSGRCCIGATQPCLAWSEGRVDGSWKSSLTAGGECGSQTACDQKRLSPLIRKLQVTLLICEPAQENEIRVKRTGSAQVGRSALAEDWWEDSWECFLCIDGMNCPIYQAMKSCKGISSGFPKYVWSNTQI